MSEYALKKALASAATKGSSTVMKQLLEKKVDPDIIVIAIGWYDIDTIVCLLLE